MFKLKQSNSYTWPVEVFLPGDGGKFIKETFDAEFKRLDMDQLKAMQKQSEAGEDDSDGANQIREILLGWKGVVDESGDVPFSESARDELLKIPQVRAAILHAFRESVTGGRRKN